MMSGPRESRRGSMTVYALVLVMLIGLFIARFSVSSIDHAIGSRLMIFDQQARQGAEAGLEIALRFATSTFTIDPASFNVTLPYPEVGSMTVYYEITSVGVGPLFASSTAFVYDRAGREVARRTVWNTIDGNGNKRMLGAWGTP